MALAHDSAEVAALRQENATLRRRVQELEAAALAAAPTTIADLQARLRVAVDAAERWERLCRAEREARDLASCTTDATASMATTERFTAPRPHRAPVAGETHCLTLSAPDEAAAGQQALRLWRWQENVWVLAAHLGVAPTPARAQQRADAIAATLAAGTGCRQGARDYATWGTPPTNLRAIWLTLPADAAKD